MTTINVSLKRTSRRTANLPGASLGTLVGLWRADTITGVENGNPLAVWPDESGNGNHLAEPSPNPDPTEYIFPEYRTNVRNGLPGVYFVGGGQITHRPIGYLERKELTLPVERPFVVFLVLSDWVEAPVGHIGDYFPVWFSSYLSSPVVFEDFLYFGAINYGEVGIPLPEPEITELVMLLDDAYLPDIEKNPGGSGPIDPSYPFSGVLAFVVGDNHGRMYKNTSLLVRGDWVGNVFPTSTLKGIRLGIAPEITDFGEPTGHSRGAGYFHEVRLYSGLLSDKEIHNISRSLMFKWGF